MTVIVNFYMPLESPWKCSWSCLNVLLFTALLCGSCVQKETWVPENIYEHQLLRLCGIESIKIKEILRLLQQWLFGSECRLVRVRGKISRAAGTAQTNNCQLEIVLPSVDIGNATPANLIPPWRVAVGIVNECVCGGEGEGRCGKGVGGGVNAVVMMTD